LAVLFYFKIKQQIFIEGASKLPNKICYLILSRT
jgi:hypothetical protein